jgi:phage gpG-like protein
MAASSGGFIRITFQIDGLKEIRRRLASWGASIQTLEPAWTDVGNAISADFMLNMIGEGGVFSKASRWAQLKPATVADRIRQGYGGDHPILQRTGDLARSLAPGGANNIFQTAPNSLTVGTSDPKAGYHQYGTRRMVARPVVGLSFTRRSLIVRTLGDYVRAQASAQGFIPTGEF